MNASFQNAFPIKISPCPRSALQPCAINYVLVKIKIKILIGHFKKCAAALFSFTSVLFTVQRKRRHARRKWGNHPLNAYMIEMRRRYSVTLLMIDIYISDGAYDMEKAKAINLESERFSSCYSFLFQNLESR
jgi:hypothetical protein